LTRIL